MRGTWHLPKSDTSGPEGRRWRGWGGQLVFLSLDRYQLLLGRPGSRTTSLISVVYTLILFICLCWKGIGLRPKCPCSPLWPILLGRSHLFGCPYQLHLRVRALDQESGNCGSRGPLFSVPWPQGPLPCSGSDS